MLVGLRLLFVVGIAFSCFLARAGDFIIEAAPSTGCQTLLTSAETPPELKPTETERRAAAELLLFLIFDHPILKEVVQRPTTSDQHLRDLFHAVNGFTIPPLDPENYGARHYDPSGYYARIRFSVWLDLISENERPPRGNPFKRLFRGRPAVHPRLQKMVDFYQYIRQPEQYAFWSNQQRIRFAKPILEESADALWSLVRVALSTQRSVPHPIELPQSSLFFTNQMGGNHLCMMAVEVPDLTVFTRREIEHLQGLVTLLTGNGTAFPASLDEMKWRPSPVRHFMLEWLCEYLPLVLQLHEETLHATQGNVAQKRSVLLEEPPLKIFLRDQILRWAQGDYSRLQVNKNSSSEAKAAGLSDYLPPISNVKLDRLLARDRLAGIQAAIHTVDQLDDQAGPPWLRHGRELMQQWDHLVALIPAVPRFNRLKSWGLHQDRFDVWKNDFLKHLNDLVIISQNDLTTLEELDQVAAKIKEKFTTLEPPLASPEESSNASLFAQKEEFQTLSLLLEQGTQILQLRIESQRRSLTSLVQMQTILRQLLHQEILGLKNQDLQNQLFQLVTELPSAPPPTSGG